MRECGAKDQVSRVGALPTLLVAAAMVAVTVVLGGCAATPRPPSAAPKSQLQAGATMTPGVLTVAVDPTFPPFAGKVGNRLAGLDVDVAAALADQLGVKVRFVEVPRSRIASAAAGKADIALSGLSTREIIRMGALPGGVYAFDGPVLFAAQPATLALDGLGGKRLGAQGASEAWWRLRDIYGDQVSSFRQLREAVVAVTAGTVEVLGGDALVAGYIARDYPTVVPVGVIAAHPVEVALLRMAPSLADPVRRALLSLEADGVLATLRTKWGGAAGNYVFRAQTGAARPMAPKPSETSGAPSSTGATAGP